MRWYLILPADINHRGRQGLISTMKITNNLLAAVLILTAVPPSIGCSQAAIEYCCSLISQKLTEPKEVSELVTPFLVSP